MKTNVYSGRLTSHQIIEKEYAGCTEQILHHAVVTKDTGLGWKEEIYAARQLPNGEVYCEIILSSYLGTETIVEVIDETMDPTQTRCPNSVLKLLTPTLDDTVRNWRNQCLKNDLIAQTRRKMIRNMAIGDILTFDIAYDGNQSLKIDRIKTKTNNAKCSGTFSCLNLKPPTILNLKNYNKHIIGIITIEKAKVHGKFKVNQRVFLSPNITCMSPEWSLRGGTIEELHEKSYIPYASVLWDDAFSTVDVALCSLESKS